MKFSILQPGNPKLKRTLLALLSLALFNPCLVVPAQPGGGELKPSFNNAGGEVSKSGYVLKPTGLSTAGWPELRLDFSIEGSGRIFKNLSLADIQPKLDGRPILLREGDLKLLDNEPYSVLLLLDGSGSMSSGAIDKLLAAKQALKTLIDSLGPADRVALVVFDEESRTLAPVTTDKDLVRKEIESFSIRKDKSRYTRLYDAVDASLALAKTNNLKNVVVISDGWEDTPETRELLLNPARLEAFKQGRERTITDSSRNEDIRVFTVAIGDEHGKGLSYVDRAALANICKGANGGDSVYLEVTGALGSKSLEQDFLRQRLQQTLDQIKQSSSYSYSLTLPLAEVAQRDEGDHKLWVGFTVGDTPQVQLPVEYTYGWTGTGPPTVRTVSVQNPIFIQSAPRSAKWHELLAIYLGVLFVLVSLGFVPALRRRLAGGGHALRLRKAIIVVDSKSALIGLACPNEGKASGGQYLIKAGDVVLVCPNPRCKTAHHLSCWCFNEHHCMKRVCELELIVPTMIMERHELQVPEFS